MNEIIVASIDDKEDSPSLLELFIIDGIYGSMKPTFEHVLRAVAESMAAPVLIERKRLYGIKYRDLGSGSANESRDDKPLKLWKKTSALVAIVIVPHLAKYIRDRALNFKRSEGRSSRSSARGNGGGGDTVYSRLVDASKKVVGYSMPYLDQLFILLDSAHHVCYAAGLTSYYKFFWRLLNITATRRRNSLVTTTIMGNNTGNNGSGSLLPRPIDSNTNSSSSSSTTSSSIVSNFYSTSKLLGAGASIFLVIKAVQMYTEDRRHRSQFPSSSDEDFYNSNSSSGTSSNDRVGVDERSNLPPVAPAAGRGGVVPPKESGLCPLCRSARQQPCASTGGYVFCYDCISNSIRKYGNFCPVTGEFCRLEDLIRLYVDDS